MAVGIHGFYWVVPLLASLVWLTGLVGLLGYWRADDLRRYMRDEASVVFISDVGAAHHPFFIGLCCATAGLYMLTVLIERHLRHKRRIPGSLHKRTTHYDIASVIFAIIGSLGLIFLSIFDAFNYSNVHWSMTVVFIIFVALSVIFQVLEVFSLAKRHTEQRNYLYASAIIKTFIITLAIAIAITFAGLYGTCSGQANPGDARCDRITSAAAVCEWTVSFLLVFFFATYCLDMFPAAKRAHHGLSEDGEMVEDRERAIAHGEGHKPDAPYTLGPDGRPAGPAHHYGGAPDMSQSTLHNTTGVHGQASPKITGQAI